MSKAGVVLNERRSIGFWVLNGLGGVLMCFILSAMHQMGEFDVKNLPIYVLFFCSIFGWNILPKIGIHFPVTWIGWVALATCVCAKMVASMLIGWALCIYEIVCAILGKRLSFL